MRTALTATCVGLLLLAGRLRRRGPPEGAGSQDRPARGRECSPDGAAQEHRTPGRARGFGAHRVPEAGRQRLFDLEAGPRQHHRQDHRRAALRHRKQGLVAVRQPDLGPDRRPAGPARVGPGRRQRRRPDDEAKSRQVEFTEPLAPGAWTQSELLLAGVPPTELGFVRLKDVDHSGIGLLQ